MQVLLGLGLEEEEEEEEEGEFLCVDISAGIAAKFRRAFDIFDIFLIVARAVSCLSHGLQFVVEAATRYLEWISGFASGAAGTLVVTLR